MIWLGPLAPADPDPWLVSWRQVADTLPADVADALRPAGEELPAAPPSFEVEPGRPVAGLLALADTGVTMAELRDHLAADAGWMPAEEYYAGRPKPLVLLRTRHPEQVRTWRR